MQRKKRIQSPEDGLFLAGWLILSAVLVLVIVKKCIFPEANIIARMFPCYIWETTGFLCPGCGGSRSVAALLRGDILVCAVNFPLTLYAVVMYLWFMISQTIQRLSRDRLAIGLHWRHAYLWIALGILIVHFILKNCFLIITGTLPFLF